MLNSLDRSSAICKRAGICGGIRIHTGYIKLYLRISRDHTRASLHRDCRRISPAMGDISSPSLLPTLRDTMGRSADTVGVHTGYDNYPGHGFHEASLDKN